MTMQKILGGFFLIVAAFFSLSALNNQFNLVFIIITMLFFILGISLLKSPKKTKVGATQDLITKDFPKVFLIGVAVAIIIATIIFYLVKIKIIDLKGEYAGLGFMIFGALAVAASLLIAVALSLVRILRKKK